MFFFLDATSDSFPHFSAFVPWSEIWAREKMLSKAAVNNIIGEGGHTCASWCLIARWVYCFIKLIKFAELRLHLIRLTQAYTSLGWFFHDSLPFIAYYSWLCGFRVQQIILCSIEFSINEYSSFSRGALTHAAGLVISFFALFSAFTHDFWRYIESKLAAALRSLLLDFFQWITGFGVIIVSNLNYFNRLEFV